MDSLSRLEYLSIQELHELIEGHRDVLAIDEWWRRYGCHHPVYRVGPADSRRYSPPVAVD